MTDVPSRLRRRLGVDLVRLAGEELSASDLRVLELAWSRARAAARSPGELLAQAAREGLFAASAADLRRLHVVDGVALAVLDPRFEAVDLSPVLPLGTARVLADTPQDNVLSATRGAEVSGDPTLGLALIAARRIRGGAGEVRLATSFRTTRMQRLASEHHVRHFRLFALATAGRRQPSDGFTTAALHEHLSWHLRFLRGLREAGFEVGSIEVRITDTEAVRALALEHGVDLAGTRAAQASEALRDAELPCDFADPAELSARWPACPANVRTRLEHVHARVTEPLREAYPEATFTYDASRLRQATYYHPLCFSIDVGGFSFGPMNLGDGGEVGWTGQLLSDRRQRFFTSGVGTELIAALLPFRG
ncbi:MAG TPA: hypothetical protein VIL20_07610 [Sandaracinaceae bacterium]